MTRRPPLHVLAEADEWIVVAKPPRLLVHRNFRNPRANAALQTVRDQVGSHVYPIHRLDRPASGCLLFAKDRTWAGPLHASLTAKSAIKTYVVFVRGWFKHDKPVFIDNPMKDDNGILKTAASNIELLGRSHEPRCSLLRVRPVTGRYHQVRRHVRDLHHPCIGDTDHGDSRVNRWWRENTQANRLGLHCIGIHLILPSGEPLDVSCPLFADQHAVFSALPWWETAREAEPRLRLPPLSVESQATETQSQVGVIKPI
jgi:tRNA pseudouridine65 synthase